jgi:extracellular factor (EF) 3-hydroxypalmitic acid methyl ester biosynthesis protein
MIVTPGFDLLSDFQGEHDNDLLAVSQPRTLQAGDVLIVEGAPRPGLFIVTRGLLDVRVGRDEPVSVGKRGPGELLGEVSLLTGEGANATVVALETCELLELPAIALDKQLQRNTRFAARFYQMLGRVVARKLTEQSRRAVPFSLAITHSPELDARLRGTVHELKAGLADLEAELGRQKGQIPAELRRRTTALLDGAMEFLRRLFGSGSEVPPALQRDVAHFLRQELLPFVLLSRVCEQGYTKRRGYAGDFHVIDLLYGNEASGTGHLGPLLDEYFLSIPVARAVRNRRALLVDVFLKVLETARDERPNITSLACGPAREIFDFFERVRDPEQAVFHCIDLDVQALSAVSRVADQRGLGASIRLVQENLILLATGRRQTSLPAQDLMYSIGLVDYFQDKLVIRLLNWMHQTLRPGGKVVLGNFDPHSPDRPFMDHLLEWPLIYRTPEDMRRLFARSAFGEQPVEIQYEPQGINLFATCSKEPAVAA